MGLATVGWTSTGWAERLCTVGFYVFAFGSLRSVSLSYIGIGLMTIGLLAQPLTQTVWRQRLTDPQITLLFAFGALTALTTHTVGARLFPETQAVQWEEWASVLKLWLFLPVAWVIAGSRTRFFRGLTCMTAGLLLGVLTHPEALTIVQLNLRSGFHLPAISFSLYCVTIAWTMLVFFARFRALLHDTRGSWLGSAVYLSIALVLFSLFTQGRSKTTFIGLILVFVVCAGWVSIRRASVVRHRKVMLPLVLIGSVLAVPMVEPIIDRTLAEYRAFSDNTEINEGVVPMTSMGFRWNIYRYGWRMFLERPWFGWGAGSSQTLTRLSADPGLTPSDQDRYFDHFHSLFLEFLVRYGIIGSLMFALAGAHLATFSYRWIAMPPTRFDERLFVISFFLLVLTFSLFDFRHAHWDFRFFWSFFAGAIYSFALKKRQTHTTQPLPGQSRSRRRRLKRGLSR